MEYKALIVGLGNPGQEYATTRHNIGFILADALIELAKSRKSMRFKELGGSSNYQLFSMSLAGNNILVTKPLTYMNLSGNAVGSICGKHSISIQDVIVVHDELDLPQGRMKFKRGGGNNGHRGLLSIQEVMKSPDFLRIRIGIGRPEFSSQVKDYVLEEFSTKDLSIADQMINAVIKGLDLYFRRGQGHATQFLHTFDPDEGQT